MKRLYFLPHPDLTTVYLLNHSHSHIPLGVARKVKVPSSSFSIPVHIVTVLAKPLPEALTGLSNLLFLTPVYSASNSIADVLAIAVQLGIKIHLVVSCRCLEGFRWMNIKTGWTVCNPTFGHPCNYSPGSSSRFWWNLRSYQFSPKV